MGPLRQEIYRMPEQFSFSHELLKEAAKWATLFVGGFVPLCFTPLIERIKRRLNRADLRAKQFESFATDLSGFMFQAELQLEFYEKGWTSPEDIEPTLKSYNAAITTFRSKEFVYLAWAQRYWSPSDYVKFQEICSVVRSVDKAVH